MINFREPTPQQKLRSKRAAREARFRWYGRLGLLLAAAMLAFMLFTIVSKGYPGFLQAKILLTVPTEILTEEGKVTPAKDNPRKALQFAVAKEFPEITDPDQLKKLFQLTSPLAELQMKNEINDRLAKAATNERADIALPKEITLWLTAADPVDRYLKESAVTRDDDTSIKLNDDQRRWAKVLEAKGALKLSFSKDFFARGDSRSPERAGFLGAMAGSLFTLLTCMLVAFPIGVLSAIYLEEFSSKGRLTDIIEVNINNLAAVPSIVFGLLGLAIYLGVFGLPRSASLVGGMTLALMILPTIIITTRASLKAIPDSIRDAARALGASPMQVVFHHVVPLAMPGIMTGTILGMARAIGETAPLLMIGMVAFVADIPAGFTDAATVMPVQIYLWASSPEVSFVHKTSAGIIVLLALLLCMNALAIVIRKKFEHRW